MTLALTPPTIDPEAEAAETPATRSRLRLYATLLLLGVMLGGYILGRTQPTGWFTWLLAFVAMVAMATLSIHLMLRHVLNPVRDLANQLDQIDLASRDMSVSELPLHRTDEIGTIARAVRRLCAGSIRDHHEAKQLRRTMVDQVRSATQKAVADLSKIAMRDALTNLGNRRYLDTHLPKLMQSARDARRDLVCVIIDMDNFKQVNDTLGHAKGDELLVLLADLLRACVRTEDMTVRLGGDEFVVFMPGTKLVRAADLTGHIRRLFRQQTAGRLGDTLRVDLSVGAASMRQEQSVDGEALLAAADRYLYVAKRKGKGITCSAEGCSAA